MFDDFEKPIYPEFYGNPDLLGDEPQPKPPLPEISVKLRAWRGKRGYREVQSIIGLRPSTMLLIEAGKLDIVSKDDLEKVKNFFN